MRSCGRGAAAGRRRAPRRRRGRRAVRLRAPRRRRDRPGHRGRRRRPRRRFAHTGAPRRRRSGRGLRPTSTPPPGVRTVRGELALLKRRWAHERAEGRPRVDSWPRGVPFEPGEQRFVGRFDAVPHLFDPGDRHAAEGSQGPTDEARRDAGAQTPRHELEQRPARRRVETVEPGGEQCRELRRRRRGKRAHHGREARRRRRGRRRGPCKS